MSEVVYLIPVSLLGAYRGRPIVVRSVDPGELARSLSGADLEKLVGVQLLSPAADVEPMADWGYSIPVEIVMNNAEAEFPLLYRHAKLLDKHPLRVSIPVERGLSKAVKVAISLQFAVKLRCDQPDASVIDELLTVVDFYLHQSTVSQPVEFLHGSFSSFYAGESVSLWSLLEEDPALIRYVNDDGSESMARRSKGTHETMTGGLDDFISRFSDSVLAEKSECADCEFFANCGGYFKWPQRNYECVGVKKVFRALKDAALELRHDVSKFDEARMEAMK